jgi:hypothetical protein
MKATHGLQNLNGKAVAHFEFEFRTQQGERGRGEERGGGGREGGGGQRETEAHRETDTDLLIHPCSLSIHPSMQLVHPCDLSMHPSM